jgi:hypothetical protein
MARESKLVSRVVQAQFAAVSEQEALQMASTLPMDEAQARTALGLLCNPLSCTDVRQQSSSQSIQCAAPATRQLRGTSVSYRRRHRQWDAEQDTVYVQ